MADQEPHSLASTFPNPPPFWRHFTPDCIARIEKLRAAAPDADALAPLPDLPDDLVYLQPPPEPADGRWRVFGDQYMLDDKLPTLEEQGITNLPAGGGAGPKPAAASSEAPVGDAREAKHYDGAFELKKLTKSLLLNFLELTGVLARNPAHAEAKMADLRILFINVHHVLNEYRPHQARESAIAMMQDHLDRTRAETLAIRSQVDKARSLLEGLGSLRLAPPPPPPPPPAQADALDGPLLDHQRHDPARLARLEREAADREREVWAATDAACA